MRDATAPDASTRPANRLAGEASPYLLQHAHNPVDWYPWGTEALERARVEDRPILLSIGYAACHWCHVMERESFEDEATARLMNEAFVCVKVDREERPDLDAIYMDAVQAMTGQGGWPMTVFLTPEGRPFFAGTYFAKEPAHGMPAFTDVLQAIARAWRDQRANVLEQGERVVRAIAGAVNSQGADDVPGEDTLRGAFASMRSAFDARWGGFGGAPKFPQPMNLEFVLRCGLRGYDGARDVLTVTLDRMAAGGIHDQVGGGFHRYSVDGRWHVPHFEKMLYDNAQLARLYVRAWQVTGRAHYRVVAERTLDYLLREMRHPDGAFFSSQDADSEGEEGRFFVWTWDELVGIAGEAVATSFGAVPDGNWEDGKNVLWTPFDLERVAREHGTSTEDLSRDVEAARRRLFEARASRVRPATDDKVLAGWNGLAIAALAEAGRALGQPRYAEAAERAAGFVLGSLRRPDGRLLRLWRDGRLGGPAYADDHAMLVDACLALYETTFDPRWFDAALELADALVRLFHDDVGGGFFQSGADAEALVVRPKELFDNAVPSANSLAADVLQRLWMLTGDASYERHARSAIALVSRHLERAPLGFGQALCALDLRVGPAREVAIAGDPYAPDAAALLARVRESFRPRIVVAAGDPDGVAPRRVPLLRDRPRVDGRPAAYVCEGFVCRLPVTSPDDLSRELDETVSRPGA